MDVLGRRINSESNVLHLMESEGLRQHFWLTLCGRKIRPSIALAPEKFDSAERCCTVCCRMRASALKVAARDATTSTTASLAS